ncbi:MAG: hypothetical protein IPK52_00915 [Chloroflexi bacterium]|nr:hypothetical protein [Chloroflexota bacterium]
MAAGRSVLEHFYVSLTSKSTDAKQNIQVAAQSANIKPDIVSRLAEKYSLDRAVLPQSFSLLRDSQGGGFFAVHVMRGSGGTPLAHYIVVPSDTLRVMHGNLRALVSLLDTTAPTFAPKTTLLPLVLPQYSPISPEQQTEDMLGLLSTAHNRMDGLEQMLAAIVQGVRLIIQNAPSDVAQRIKLVDGLLALMPPSVRFAVTFTTDSARHNDVDCQISFAREQVNSAEVVRFDWSNGQTFGMPLKDDYARFVVSQLRLDTSLVIERTSAMTPAAGWYLSQGHRLAEALSYGSYRLKVDEALLSGQPINKEDAADILQSDPTLSDSLRASYARHLLRLALVMHAVTDADPVAQLFVKFPELERDALIQLASACHKGEAPDVYRLVSRWLIRDIELPSRHRWEQLAQRAALLAAKGLAEAGDLSGLSALIPELNATGRVASLGEISKPLLETLLPFATKGSDLANEMFLMVTDLMDAKEARAFLSTPSLQSLLPPALGQFMAALNANPKDGHAGVLLNAAKSLGTQSEGRLLSHFALWARQGGRIQLLDPQVLSALARTAIDADPETRENIFQLVEHITQDELAQFGQNASYQVLRIKLALGDYTALGVQLRLQSRTLYVGDQQFMYLKVIERLFAETPIAATEIPKAMAALAEQGIVAAPLAMAALGSLHMRETSPSVDAVATDAIGLIREHSDLIAVLPPVSMARLAGYLLRSNNTRGAAETAIAIAKAAEKQKVSSVDAVRQLIEAAGKDVMSRSNGSAILRGFVRHSNSKEHPQLLAYLSREFGLENGQQFENSTFIHSLMLGRDLPVFLRSAAITFRFLGALNAMFASGDGPEAETVETYLTSLPGALSQQERAELRGMLLELIKALTAATEAKRASKPREDKLTSSFDVLRAMGVALSNTAFNQPELPKNQSLGVPDKQALKQAVSAALAITLRLARPAPVTITARGVKAEVESLLLTIDDEAQQLVHERAPMLVQLARIVPEIGAEGSSNLLEANNYTKKLDIGKQKPRSELEVIRYMIGYFGRLG